MVVNFRYSFSDIPLLKPISKRENPNRFSHRLSGTYQIYSESGLSRAIGSLYFLCPFPVGGDVIVCRI